MSAPAPGALDRASAAAERGATLVLRGHADPDSPWQPVRLVIVWLLTRLVVVMIVPVAPFVVGDVNYYATVLTGQADADFPGTLREYPVPALWVLKLPAILAGNEIKAYGWWFVFVMIVVDGLFLLALQRIGRSPRAVTAWLVAGVAIGPLLVLRFDLLTGAAVAVARPGVLAPAAPRRRSHGGGHRHQAMAGSARRPCRRLCAAPQGLRARRCAHGTDARRGLAADARLGAAADTAVVPD